MRTTIHVTRHEAMKTNGDLATNERETRQSLQEAHGPAAVCQAGEDQCTLILLEEGKEPGVGEQPEGPRRHGREMMVFAEGGGGAQLSW